MKKLLKKLLEIVFILVIFVFVLGRYGVFSSFSVTKNINKYITIGAIALAVLAVIIAVFYNVYKKSGRNTGKEKGETDAPDVHYIRDENRGVVNTCNECGYRAEFKGKCPICGSRNKSVK